MGWLSRWLVTETTVTVHKGNTLSVACVTRFVYRNFSCLGLGAGGKWPCTTHISSSFAGIRQQTKVGWWQEKRSFRATVLGQSTSNCLNCFTKHLVSTSNRHKTFSFRWCLRFFFSVYICFYLFLHVRNEVIDSGRKGKSWSKLSNQSNVFRYLTTA